jgi:hypothetical protein
VLPKIVMRVEPDEKFVKALDELWSEVGDGMTG